MRIHTVDEGYIEVTRCFTAHDFLDYLRISHNRWLPINAASSSWIFRGQRRAEWSLVPHALRRDCSWFIYLKDTNRELATQLLEQLEIRYAPNEYQPDIDTLCELVLQVYAERYSVEEFIALADAVGHTIPEDKRWGFGEITLHNVIKSFDLHTQRKEERAYHFIPAGIEFSLAQHHGIPTRLLDWTIRPYAAAFFAAEEVVNNIEANEHDIAVWAIDRTSLEQITELRIVEQRRAKISYLHAQGGIFVCDSGANRHFAQSRRWRSFEDVISSGHRTSEQSLLRKVTMPASESFELLRLLAVEDITRARLMPTLDNITDTLKMMRRIVEQRASAFQSL